MDGLEGSNVDRQVSGEREDTFSVSVTDNRGQLQESH